MTGRRTARRLMHSRSPKIVLAWLGLYAAGLGGCSFQTLDEHSLAAPANECSESSDCPATASCVAGMCVAGNAPSLSVHLEVTTRPSAAEAPLTFDAKSLLVDRPRHSVTLKVPRAIEIAGNLTHEGAPVAAELRFTPSDYIPGVQPRTIVTTTSAGQLEDASGESADFVVRLLSGVRYRLVVQPTDSEALPPLYTSVGPHTKERVRRDLSYDDYGIGEQRFIVSGIPGGQTLSVRAVDQDSGKLLSSVARASSDPADVVLRFGPEPAAFRLVLAPATTESEPPELSAPVAYPTFSLPDDALTPDTSGMYEDPDVPAWSVALPPVPDPIVYEGFVAGECDDLTRFAEVGSTSITLRSTDLDLTTSSSTDAISSQSSPLKATFSTTSTLGSTNGVLSFSLLALPGSYDVVVIPPANSGCAVFAESRALRPPEGATTLSGALLELVDATPVSGMLMTSEGQAMGGATVVARALRKEVPLDTASSALTTFNRSKQTSTGMLGRFDLLLDPGSYDLTLKPPRDSGFAWHTLYEVQVGTTAPLDQMFTFDAPVPIQGQLGEVVDDATAPSPYAEAEIRAYAEITNPQTQMTRTAMIGTAVADERGTFTLLVTPTVRWGWFGRP